jgi:hypothetical protein
VTLNLFGRRPIATLVAVAALSFAASACNADSEDSTSPNVQVPNAIQIVTGDNINVTRGTTASTALSVRAVNEAGAPVSGIAIKWQIAQGFGSVSEAVKNTDQSGISSVTFTAGPDAGEVWVTASALGVLPRTLRINVQ